MLSKKALLVTTVSGFIPQFEMNNVRILQNMGYEVHYATNYNNPSYGKDNHRLDDTGIIRHQIDFVRSPFKPANIKVYQQLLSLMRREQFDLVHCHTPMGGVMARLAAHHTHTAPVIYTAHGFHFFKSASWINWIFYYPVERFLSRYTDQQICINQEDYQRAKADFHAKYVDYVPGVGIDLSKIHKLDKLSIESKKLELGLPVDKLIFMSSGELIKRKNHESAIRAVAKIKKQYIEKNYTPPKFHYAICGHGELDEYLHNLIQSLDISDMVSLLGYREDMLNIYQIADIFLFPSYQEGLPIALLEAMACGLPVICSDIRGNQDLMGKPISNSGDLKTCRGGIMIHGADNIDAIAEAIIKIQNVQYNLSHLGQENALIAQNFSIENVSEKMKQIYKKVSNLHIVDKHP